MSSVQSSTLPVTGALSPARVAGTPGLGGRDEPLLWGLPTAAWLKIAVLGALFLLLYWANLTRLWVKTNPFTGQGNWEHALFIPIIGLYYLYVWRDKLLGRDAPAAPPASSESSRWTLPGVWALLMGAPLIVAAALLPALPFDSVRGALSSLLDGGVTDFILLMFVLGGWAAACAGFVYLKREDMSSMAGQRWLDRVWRNLGAWAMLACTLWGVAFFPLVMAGTSLESILLAVRYTLAALGLAGLAVAVTRARDSWVAKPADRLLNSSATWFGTFVMFFGILFSFWGIWPGQNDFFKDVGMVIALFGVTTLVAGWRVMRVAWFPIAYLLCAIPWPDQVYSIVAMPLQNFAAKIGVFALQITGVDANKFGTKIAFNDAAGVPQLLNVEEACAGLKSLMTFVSVSAAVAFLSSRLLWQKLFIVAAAVPIAIACNAARVAGQGLLHRYVDEQWSQNFAHSFAGLVMLIPGFFLILLVCWLLDRMFVEVTDEPQPAASARKAVAVAPQPAATKPVAVATGTPAAQAAAKPAAAVAGANKVITIPKRPAGLTPPRPAVAPQVARTPAASVPPATKPATMNRPVTVNRAGGASSPAPAARRLTPTVPVNPPTQTRTGESANE